MFAFVAAIALVALALPSYADGSDMKIVEDSQRYSIRVKDLDWVQFNVPRLGEDRSPDVRIEDAADGWQRVSMVWELDTVVAQDEVSVGFDVQLDPDFWWAPHLSPEDGHCIGQHMFRSPAMLASQGGNVIAVVPDLDICGANKENPWFMDLDAPRKRLWLGMVRTQIVDHVGYKKIEGMKLGPGKVELGFFVKAYADEAQVLNPWEQVSKFLWERWGRPLYAHGEPNRVPMDKYVEHTYNWAFNTWKDAVWQEFMLDAKRVGAPSFIVNQTESPNYPGEVDLREFVSIWNQAWFSSLRSASGVLRYANRTGRADLAEKAMLTKELALSAPMKDGIFPSVYRTVMESVEINGRHYRRSKGWETGYWCNSNRCPRERGIDDTWYHILDASWTGLLMLRWYDELESDSRLLDYATRYADKLLTLQDKRGFFPAWLHPETLEPSEVLADSPETSMSITFLLKLAQISTDEKYRDAGIRAMDAVIKEVVPVGRWEDFETYWSCNSFGVRSHLGKKFERNAMYKQNSLSMFWTAEALLEAYRATRDEKYLRWGRRTLDELSMCQQVWQPPFIYVPALGGFGVMNYDGEWNDSRQSLFAGLFLQYYRETGDAHLFERGVSAIKSGFIMMYCPENPKAKEQWEKVHPFFGPQDYGFTMENYGHGGVASEDGGGMGVFTIYDWGNGAASEARNHSFDHFGDVYIDRPGKQAFGLDSIQVKPVADGFELTDLANSPRDVKVVFEDGRTETVRLEGNTRIGM